MEEETTITSSLSLLFSLRFRSAQFQTRNRFLYGRRRRFEIRLVRIEEIASRGVLKQGSFVLLRLVVGYYRVPDPLF